MLNKVQGGKQKMSNSQNWLQSVFSYQKYWVRENISGKKDVSDTIQKHLYRQLLK